MTFDNIEHLGPNSLQNVISMLKNRTTKLEIRYYTRTSILKRRKEISEDDFKKNLKDNVSINIRSKHRDG